MLTGRHLLQVSMTKGKPPLLAHMREGRLLLQVLLMTGGLQLQAHKTKPSHLSSMGKEKNLLLVLRMTESHLLEVHTRNGKIQFVKCPSLVLMMAESNPWQANKKKREGHRWEMFQRQAVGKLRLKMSRTEVRLKMTLRRTL